MILVDTGPLVALFDPLDSAHARCVDALSEIAEPIATTVPVLTEAFHLLRPGSKGAANLRDFVTASGLRVLFLDHSGLLRTFELMAQYDDTPMDLADASLVAVAEARNVGTIFTIDRKDFDIYRRRQGHRLVRFAVIA